MNPEDNIKNFFQSRLKETTTEAEGWNIPSDDIWERAKADFPKEEKSRRPFILWFFGLAGLIMVSAIAYTQLIDNNRSEILVTNDSLNNSNILKQNDVETTTNIISQSQTNTEEETNTESINITESNAQVETNRSYTSSSNTLKENYSNFETKQATDIQTTKRKLNSNSKDLIGKNFNSNSNSATSNGNIDKSKTNLNTVPEYKIKNEAITEITKGNIESSTTTDHSTTDQIASQQSKRSETVNTPLANDLALLAIDDLPTRGMATLEYDKIQNIEAELIISPLKQNKKWEIGLSSSPLLLPIAKLINADTTENEISEFKLKYFALNIPVTRILNKRWSISSGLYFKRGYMSAQFTDSDTLDIRGNISLRSNSDNAEARLTIENKSQNITLDLKRDEEILEGDIITANGYGRVNFNLIQIPLFTNFHIRKNRFEYIFSIGASLDLAMIKFSEFDITLSKENRIISEPINFTSFSENAIYYSLYGAIGTKFHFNESVNLSYSLKADLTDIIFSTHEIGLHYRF